MLFKIRIKLIALFFLYMTVTLNIASEEEKILNLKCKRETFNNEYVKYILFNKEGMECANIERTQMCAR